MQRFIAIRVLQSLMAILVMSMISLIPRGLAAGRLVLKARGPYPAPSGWLWLIVFGRARWPRRSTGLSRYVAGRRFRPAAGPTSWSA